jgi:hypothetical protein
MACLLAHLANLFIDSLNSHTLDFADGYTIQSHLIIRGTLLLLGDHALLHLFLGEKTSLARLVKPSFEPFIFAFCIVLLRDIQRCGRHADLIFNALNLVLLHLLGYGRSQILRTVLLLISLLLLLNFRGLIVNPINSLSESGRMLTLFRSARCRVSLAKPWLRWVHSE